MMYSALGKNRHAPSRTSASGMSAVSPGRLAAGPSLSCNREAAATAAADAASMTRSRVKLYR